MTLFKNVRFYVLCFSVLLSLFEYLFAQIESHGDGPIGALIHYYALTSLVFLYIALFIGPATKLFVWLPWKGSIVKARRGIGVSAFYFGLLHALIAFIFVIGGLEGLLSLNLTYYIALTLSFTALVILGAMAATSFDKVIAKMTFPKWKKLHQLVYIAGIAVVIHAFLIGEHFRGGIVSFIAYPAIIFLIGLHLYGLYKKHQM